MISIKIKLNHKDLPYFQEVDTNSNISKQKLHIQNILGKVVRRGNHRNPNTRKFNERALSQHKMVIETQIITINNLNNKQT